MPPLGTVNLHASLLPDYRGAAPINWAIMNGERCSGVTTFLLKHEIDTGNLIFQERVEIGPNMTAGELHDQLMYTGADLLVKTVEAMTVGNYPLQDQAGLLAGREPKHAPKIFKEDMKVDWTLDLDTIFNHIRGLSPFPTAWTEFRNKKTGETVSLKIFETERIVKEHGKEVGLSTDNKTYLDVLVEGGIIRIKELQLSGKKRMKTEEFLRGFHIEDYSL